MATTTLRRRAALMALLRAFKPGTPGVGRRVGAIPRMIKATFRREYDGAFRLALLALAGLFIVSPLDVAQLTFLLPLGIVDDTALVVWAAGALLDETERFLAWEDANHPSLKNAPRVVR